MNKILAIFLLVFSAATTTHAAILGAPFLPEIDSRFDQLEGDNGVTANSVDGLHVEHLAVATYDFAVCGGSSSVSCNTHVQLPAGSMVTRAFIVITTQVASLRGALLQFGCTGAADLFAATKLSTVPAPLPVDGIPTGSSTLFVNNAAACNITAAISGNAANSTITAGVVQAFVKYVIHK